MSTKDVKNTLWPCEKWALVFGIPGLVGLAAADTYAAFATKWQIIPIAFVVSLAWVLFGHFVVQKHWTRKWRKLLEAP